MTTGRARGRAHAAGGGARGGGRGRGRGREGRGGRFRTSRAFVSVRARAVWIAVVVVVAAAAAAGRRRRAPPRRRQDAEDGDDVVGNRARVSRIEGARANRVDECDANDASHGG